MQHYDITVFDPHTVKRRIELSRIETKKIGNNEAF